MNGDSLSFFSDFEDHMKQMEVHPQDPIAILIAVSSLFLKKENEEKDLSERK